jgi:ADP-ribose pyrophosphatase YjhB (NUDIX family)
VGAVILDGDAILLIERGGEPLRGYWSLPGGVVETGETLEEAIRREMQEETGLDVHPDSIFEIFERIMPDSDGRPEYHYVLVDFLCTIRGGTMVAGDDVSRVEWVHKDRLSSLLLTEGTLPVIEKAFAKCSTPVPSYSNFLS